MIDGKDLSRCIDILSELNANCTSRKNKQLILELGYIIKQELDLVKQWESRQNEQRLRQGGMPIDINKLLEDNAQLYKDNETLLKNIAKLKEVIEIKLPSVQEDLADINKKFDILNSYVEDNIC